MCKPRCQLPGTSLGLRAVLPVSCGEIVLPRTMCEFCIDQRIGRYRYCGISMSRPCSGARLVAILPKCLTLINGLSICSNSVDDLPLRMMCVRYRSARGTGGATVS
ncbi:hypothetical protein F4824DRAFT_457716 [Ustulina deusta]|nr:hypothetical protein F4824DRAFT_457716 [Ustulina deusta]